MFANESIASWTTGYASFYISFSSEYETLKFSLYVEVLILYVWYATTTLIVI